MRDRRPEPSIPDARPSGDEDDLYELTPEHELDESDSEYLLDEEDSPALPLDPLFAYVVVIGVAILGLGSFAPDARYTVLWSALVVIALLAILLDDIEIEPLRLRDVALGAGYGALIGVPILAVGSTQLHSISESIFVGLPHSAVFLAAAFAMPMAETLFFRGAFQGTRGIVPTVIASGVWTALLFFPAMNVIQYPLVAVVIGVFFLFANFVYSYLRARFGMFAAWSCQIALSVALLFAPRFVR